MLTAFTNTFLARYFSIFSDRGGSRPIPSTFDDKGGEIFDENVFGRKHFRPKIFRPKNFRPKTFLTKNFAVRIAEGGSNWGGSQADVSPPGSEKIEKYRARKVLVKAVSIAKC